MLTITTRDDFELEGAELQSTLGKGPMRFGPARLDDENDVATIVKSRGIKPQGLQQYAYIKLRWEQDFKKLSEKKNFTDAEILRFTIFAEFDEQKTIQLMKKTDRRYFDLTAYDLDSQLRTETVYPVPGLKAKDGSNVVYMRPSNYSPKDTPTSVILDNLIYVMNSVVTKDPTHGLAFVANMSDCTMANFSHEYWMKFMHALQGQVFPVKANLFLIVNAPAWFENVWGVMKLTLSKEFREKVHMIEEDDLGMFLGFEHDEYLHDEFFDGFVNTEELVRDYIAFQQDLEKEKAAKKNGGLVRQSSANNLSTLKDTSKASSKRRFGWRRRQQEDTTFEDTCSESSFTFDISTRTAPY